MNKRSIQTPVGGVSESSTEQVRPARVVISCAAPKSQQFNAVRAQEIADKFDVITAHRLEGLVKGAGSSSRSLRRQYERELRIEAKRMKKAGIAK